MADDQDTPTVPKSAQGAAADLIRAKLAGLYNGEPEASAELQEIKASGSHSKHQEFMQNLQSSGKSIAEIQTAWHEYYQSLHDLEKHEVWQEFYENQSKYQQRAKLERLDQITVGTKVIETNKPFEPHTTHDLRQRIRSKVTADGKLKASHQIKSAVFAIAFAMVATGLLFVVTNNERFIAPFITPSKNVSAAPIISDGTSIGLDAKIIIPKINLEAPLVFSAPDESEDSMQAALETGVTHYPSTAKPGETGNTMFFGHSSNNLLNKGSYKFVFVRLHQLEVGDTYSINYNGRQYVYKVFERQIVKPTQVDILTAVPKPNMSTLITCDPPGTSNNRLVIWGEQISPDPTKNIASSADATVSGLTNQIPGNAPSLWSHFLDWLKP